jgi:hypothetical protein
MAKFQYTLSEDDNEDRVYARVDDVFDISNLGAEEGLIIDVYDNDEIDLPGTLAIYDDSLARNKGV